MNIKKFIEKKMGANLDGLRFFFSEESSSYYLVIATVLILLATFVLKIGSLQTEIIILHIAIIWITEMVNTAIEVAVDSKTKDYSLDAKRAKDVASAAVFAGYVFFAINLIVSMFWD